MFIVSHVEGNRNQLRNFVLHPLAAAPSSPILGQGYYDTALGAPRYYNGAGWDLKASDTSAFNGQTASYYLNRGYHTGTQTASTISDLATVVKAYTLNSFAAPTANIPMAGYTFTGLATPGSAGQAAEYQWVLNQISAAFSQGIKAIKDPVRGLIASQIALTGIPSTSAADTLTLAANDRVLLTGQTDGTQNGLWLVQSGAWTRPIDFDQSNEIETGTEVLVNEGSVYGGSVWRITTTGTLTLGSTALAWQQVNKMNTYTNGNGLALVGTVFSVVAATGGGLVVNASGVSVDRTKVGYIFAQTIGDGSATSFTITHNLATVDVIPACRDTATNTIVYPDYVVTSANVLTVSFAGTAPTTGQYRVTVHG